MAVSTSSIAMMCLLFVGMSLCLIEIRVKRTEVEHSSRLSTPTFGGIETRRSEGPWPECLELTGDSCVALLELYTHGLDIQVVGPGDKLAESADFRVDRVRIYINESNIVNEIPKRG